MWAYKDMININKIPNKEVDELQQTGGSPSACSERIDPSHDGMCISDLWCAFQCKALDPNYGGKCKGGAHFFNKCFCNMPCALQQPPSATVVNPPPPPPSAPVVNPPQIAPADPPSKDNAPADSPSEDNAPTGEPEHKHKKLKLRKRKKARVKPHPSAPVVKPHPSAPVVIPLPSTPVVIPLPSAPVVIPPRSAPADPPKDDPAADPPSEDKAPASAPEHKDKKPWKGKEAPVKPPPPRAPVNPPPPNIPPVVTPPPALPITLPPGGSTTCSERLNNNDNICILATCVVKCKFAGANYGGECKSGPHLFNKCYCNKPCPAQQ